MGNQIQIVDARPGDVIKAPLINQYSALSITAYWRAINFLANNLASFDRDVYHNDLEVEEGHYLDYLLERRPNQWQTSPVFFRTLFFHAGHTGNGYAKIKWAGNRVAAMYNMCPEHVTPFRFVPQSEDGQPGDPWDAQQYYYYAPSKTVMPAADVAHIALLGWDGLVGYDPITLMASTFVQAASIQRYQTKFVQKGTIIRGSVEIPGGVPEEKALQVVNTVRQFFSGPDAERDVIVLSDGAKLGNATLTPQQSQLIEWDRDITKKISQITGVPPRHLFELGEQQYAGDAEQDGIDLVRYTFRPLLDLINAELTAKLLTYEEQNAGYSIRLDPSALEKGNTSAITTNVVALTTGGIIDANEGRTELGYPPHADPEAKKLKVLGDTTVNKTAAAPTTETPTTEEKTVTNSAQPAAPDAYAALAPIITAAITRVETKATNAITNASKKVGQERTIWSNVFSAQQATYAKQELEPVAAALASMTGKTLDLEELGERYATTIRKRAAGVDAKSLNDLLGDMLHGNAAATE